MDGFDAPAAVRRRDFFISYSQADQQWAEWIAWQLEDAGYEIALRAWDELAGSSRLGVVQAGLAESDRTIVVLSPAYLAAAEEQNVWFAAAQADPLGLGRRLVPVTVEDCAPAGVLGGFVPVDLVGLDQDDARAELLGRVRHLLAGRAKPVAEPAFPGPPATASTSTSTSTPPPAPLFPGPAVTVARRPSRARQDPPGPPSLTQLARLTHVERSQVPGSAGWVRSVAFSPDGRLLATAGVDGVCRLWDVAEPHEPALAATLSGHVGSVGSVAFSVARRLLATAGHDGMCRLWDVSEPARPVLVTVLTGHVGSVGSVAFSPDGRLLATAGHDGAWQLWDLSDRSLPTRTAVVAGHAGEVSAVAFSASGGLLASGGQDSVVRVWDVARVRAAGDSTRPTPVAELAGHTQAVGSVAFSPNGRVLAAAGHDGTCRTWELAVDDGEYTRAAVLTGHRGSVWALAFSPAGRFLASGGADRAVRLWDVSQKAEMDPVLVPAGRSGWVSAVAFSPDGQLLATASGRSVVVWQLA